MLHLRLSEETGKLQYPRHDLVVHRWALDLELVEMRCEQPTDARDVLLLDGSETCTPGSPTFVQH